MWGGLSSSWGPRAQVNLGLSRPGPGLCPLLLPWSEQQEEEHRHCQKEGTNGEGTALRWGEPEDIPEVGKQGPPQEQDTAHFCESVTSPDPFPTPSASLLETTCARFRGHISKYKRGPTGYRRGYRKLVECFKKKKKYIPYILFHKTQF